VRRLNNHIIIHNTTQHTLPYSYYFTLYPPSSHTLILPPKPKHIQHCFFLYSRAPWISMVSPISLPSSSLSSFPSIPRYPPPPLKSTPTPSSSHFSIPTTPNCPSSLKRHFSFKNSKKPSVTTTSPSSHPGIKLSNVTLTLNSKDSS